ncbi:Uncharacterised protein [Vibrio cholerae]|nr:Uncharacterised protein [Vibrio cholerae]
MAVSTDVWQFDCGHGSNRDCAFAAHSTPNRTFSEYSALGGDFNRPTWCTVCGDGV